MPLSSRYYPERNGQVHLMICVHLAQTNNLQTNTKSIYGFFFFGFKTQFIFHGDLPQDENALCIMNHQCTTDWFLMDLLGDFVGAVGRVRFVLKVGSFFPPVLPFFSLKTSGDVRPSYGVCLHGRAWCTRLNMPACLSCSSLLKC